MRLNKRKETELASLIHKWTDSCRFRPDFAGWVKRRIWQEKETDKHWPYLCLILGDLQGQRVLDLGSGMGGLLTTLRAKNIQAFGLDYNFDYTKIAQLRGGRYKLFHWLVQGSGEHLPYKDKAFDLIFCLDVLEHVEDPKAVLFQMARVLKRKGRVFVTVINRFGFRDPHYHLRFINWLPRQVGEWLIKNRKRQKNYCLFQDKQKLSEMHYFTKASFIKLCREGGFKVNDLGLVKIKEPNLIQSSSLRSKVVYLNRLRLTGCFYRLYAFFWQTTWEFILCKK